MTRPPGILLAAAGVLVALAAGALAAGLTIAVGALLSLAGVLAVAAFFHAIGLSEERDRRRHPRG
jgi:hypothetical protein